MLCAVDNAGKVEQRSVGPDDDETLGAGFGPPCGDLDASRAGLNITRFESNHNNAAMSFSDGVLGIMLGRQVHQVCWLL